MTLAIHPSRVVGIDVGGTSTKVAHWSDDGFVFAQSRPYRHPSRDELVGVISDTLDELSVDRSAVQSVGLCLPGKQNQDRSAIEYSINLPILNEWRFDALISQLFGEHQAKFRVLSDADATGVDLVSQSPIEGRSAIIAIGTGVGLCVCDGPEPIRIGRGSIGHLGQLDVGRCDQTDRYDHSGARNTLESYIGLRALEEWRTETGIDLSRMTSYDPSVIALVQAIRMVHAIYRPDRIILAGGVGIALRPLAKVIFDQVNQGLTPLANSGWTLEFGSDGFHAARGVHRWALRSS